MSIIPTFSALAGQHFDVSKATDRLRFNADWLTHRLGHASLAPWIDEFAHALEVSRPRLRHGDLPRWRAAIGSLPPVHPSARHFDRAVVAAIAEIGADDSRLLGQAVYALRPWRKGPYRLADRFVDAEWRSDFKWKRLIDHITPLAGRRVLDVGCGNGYHLWRMRGAGASEVLGIDPGVLNYMQFSSVQHCMHASRVTLLPLKLEAMPPAMRHFDSVFSMGVLYHRRSPEKHLEALQGTLQPRGELVLETLVIAGDEDASLPIKGRYARMRNVWCLPTVTRLERWLATAGFDHIRTIASDVTTTDEQRRTAWSTGQSLADALDPIHPEMTIEGYPRPRRAILLATAAG